jgi:heme/copper-type cytochrome/quinol oxidase subunit 1
MTATETHTDSHEESTDPSMGSAFTAFTSNDHKAIGRMWVGVSLLFLLAIAALAVLAGLERTDPGGIDIFGNLATYFQAWTLVRTGGVFMVAIPLLIGIGTAIVPLQVGARSIAFPRLAAASFWTWLVAAGIHLASFLADGGLGPEAGTDRDGTLLTLVSLAAMVIALLGGVLCIVTTIIALRPEGMGLRDVPMFSWSMLVAGSVWLFSLPILLANLLFAFVDLQGRDPIFFGDADRIWANVEWAFMQPQLFAIAIPVLGIAGDVVPVATGSRLGGRGIIQTGIGLFGAMTFGAWAQHSFSRGADPAFPEGALLYEEFLFGLFSHLALFGAFMAIGGILTPLRNGPKMSAAVLGSVASLLLLLLGLTIGAIRTLNNVIGALLATSYTGEIDAAGARIVADRKFLGLFEVSNDEVFNILHDNNTLLATNTAQFYVVVATVIAGAAAAVAFWGPKLFGGYARNGAASGAAMTALAGGGLAGIAYTISAFMGQADISVSSVDGDIQFMNVLGLVGIALLLLSGLSMIGAVAGTSNSDEQLPDDPWDGFTLEWATPSPPPVGNFIEPIGPITSAEPLLDELEEVG